MRAMRLVRPAPIGDHPLSLTAEDIPAPAADELLLRVAVCAVCRTDLQLCEGDLAAHRLPFTPGHQIVGHVIGKGDQARGFEVGDRVGVAWLARACGACARCREGRENLCDTARFTGWDRDGGYAEYALACADFALRIPDSFDDASAAPLLCGGVIGYRALKLSTIRPGQRLGLFGFGASALIALQIAQYWGCRVFVCTRSVGEQQRARQLGAEWAGGYDEKVPEALDAAVTFAPAGRVVLAALEALDRGGTVVVNAIHLDEVPSFAYERLWWERSVKSVANFTRADARELLDLAAHIPLRTHVELFPLADANVALERLKAGNIAGAAVLQVAK